MIALERSHEVASFDCGQPLLNRWLQTIASQHQKNGMSKTFVAVDELDPGVILGFFTMALRTPTRRDELPPEFQRKLTQQVPGFNLARLGVSVKRQGEKLGSFLLLEAMEKAYRASQNVGGYALFVDAKDGLASFYEYFNFKPLISDPNILVMPIASMPKFLDANRI